MSFPPFNGVESEQFSICRCCLSKECCKDIAAEFNDSGSKEVYQEMLQDVFNIQISSSLPVRQFICEDCIARIRASSSFKRMVVNNHEMYLECLQNYLNTKDNLDGDLKSDEIKIEPNMDFDSKDFEDASFGDDEILENLKFETEKSSDLDTSKQSHSDKIKKKRCKLKEKDNESQNKSKLSERRGNGPILRENSLKLLANSTATVFQWNKSQYTCFCCKQPHTDINTLKKHTEKSHTLNEIQKKIITQQNRLVKVEISQLNCKICSEQLSDLENLRIHLINHSIVIDEHLLIPFKIEKTLNCQICLEKFTLFRLLNIHMNKHYQKHVCHVCGAGFSNLVFLNLHRTRSHRVIECQNCQISFKSRSDKKNHDVLVHKIKFERKKRFPCPYCTDRFYQENLRVIHLVETHGFKKPEFVCQFCSKSFVTKSLLNNHVKVVHMKEKCHECYVCHSFFYTKSDVTRHSVTHTGEKKFSCTICSSLFATKDSLRRHMKRTHVVN